MGPPFLRLHFVEAVDAFNHRMEIIANQREEANTDLKRLQDAVQDEVELTQAERLKLHGCVCTSPRLEISGDSEVDGFYLYQGLDSRGRPTYRSALFSQAIQTQLSLSQAGPGAEESAATAGQSQQEEKVHWPGGRRGPDRHHHGQELDGSGRWGRVLSQQTSVIILVLRQ